MKSGGLPCRVQSCRLAFAVRDGDSMPALLEASARRTAHELEAHAYEHVIPAEPEPEGLRAASLGLRRRRIEASG
jgi:hypothetical protein